MAKDIWLNLPVKDVQKTKTFFTKLGFSFNTQYGHTDISEGMIVGEKKFVVMFFEENTLRGFMQNQLVDTKQANETMISIGAESEQEVNEMAKKVEEAGGVVFAKPAEIQGWMYGCAFTDPDGHRWNMLYMDMSKMPK